MQSIKTEIVINASPKRVWSLLMDNEKYAKWNPFIIESNGDFVIGQKVTNTMTLDGKKTQSFSPTILNVESNKELRWLGHALIKGLFDGEHYFQLEALEDNQTRLIQGEKFTGILVSPILKMIKENTIKGFEAMNKALKTESEKH